MFWTIRRKEGEFCKSWNLIHCTLYSLNWLSTVLLGCCMVRDIKKPVLALPQQDHSSLKSSLLEPTWWIRKHITFITGCKKQVHWLVTWPGSVFRQLKLILKKHGKHLTKMSLLLPHYLLRSNIELLWSKQLKVTIN